MGKALKPFDRSRCNLILFTLVLLLAFPACKFRDGSGSSGNVSPDPISDTQPSPTPIAKPTATPRPATPTPLPPTTPSPAPSPGAYKAEVPLLWESARSEGRNWTIHSFDVIDRSGAALLQGANDVQDFCPQFYNLTYNQKVNFWAYLISAITKYESGFKPTSRYVETTMGTDPVTGQQVASEGLLQLSYQDGRSYPFCNEFDWNQDKNLSPTDPAKTILNPEKNLTCGIRILDYQISHRKAIAVASGAYWAVIKSDSKYSKLTEIKALTNSLSFCK